MIKSQLQSEAFPPAAPGGPQRGWSQMPHEERAKMLKDRLKKYCQKVNEGGRASGWVVWWGGRP
jgi:DNA polymerase epsilon subunit 1